MKNIQWVPVAPRGDDEQRYPGAKRKKPDRQVFIINPDGEKGTRNTEQNDESQNAWPRDTPLPECCPARTRVYAASHENKIKKGKEIGIGVFLNKPHPQTDA